MSPGPQIPTTTRYEFIVHTGVEDASAKQKLKTVRSHVMRNYLHQQQLQSGHSSDSAVSERRHSKQRARSYRSASRDTNTSTSSNTTTNPRARSAPGHAELLQSTFRAAPSSKSMVFTCPRAMSTLQTILNEYVLTRWRNRSKQRSRPRLCSTARRSILSRPAV